MNSMTELQQKCFDKAQQIASEINGDLFYVPDEDIEKCMQYLNEDNLHDVASEIAQLAHWYN